MAPADADRAGAERVAELVARFRFIAADRMTGLPIVNPALSVESFGCVVLQEEWLTVLVTPWFLNLVLLPMDRARGETRTQQVGAKRSVMLPAGSFEFIVSHDEVVGPFAMCSLFSPVFEFSDQPTAMAAAEAAMAAVFVVSDDNEDEDMIRLWQGEDIGRQAGEAAEGDLGRDIGAEPLERAAEGASLAPRAQEGSEETGKGLNRRALFLGRAPSRDQP